MLHLFEWKTSRQGHSPQQSDKQRQKRKQTNNNIGSYSIYLTIINYRTYLICNRRYALIWLNNGHYVWLLWLIEWRSGLLLMEYGDCHPEHRSIDQRGRDFAGLFLFANHDLPWRISNRPSMISQMNSNIEANALIVSIPRIVSPQSPLARYRTVLCH